MGGHQMIKEHIAKRHLFHNRGQGHRLFGFTLSAVGFFWLAKKVGWISMAESGLAIFWPLAIIILGLFIALRTCNDRNNDAKKDVHTSF
jgi:hypothetical protein